MPSKEDKIGTDAPLHKLKEHCRVLESSLKPPYLKPEEKEALHGKGREDDMVKDDWWRRLVELSSYARRKEFGQLDSGGNAVVDEGPLMDAIEDVPIEVDLRNRTVRVYPASFSRIGVVEDLDFWLKWLGYMYTMYRANPDLVMDGSRLREVLGGIREAEGHIRGKLYAQITAPGPEPLEIDNAPKWAMRITPAEHNALLDAWLEVNVMRPKRAEQVIKQKYPTKPSKGADSAPGTMQGFPFLFASQSYRTEKPVKHYINDRSLAEQLVSWAAHAQKEIHEQEKREKERKKNANKSR